MVLLKIGNNVSNFASTNKKICFTNDQIKECEKFFKNSEFVDKETRFFLSRKLALSDIQIMGWFQNRRTEEKLKKAATNAAYAKAAALSWDQKQAVLKNLKVGNAGIKSKTIIRPVSYSMSFLCKNTKNDNSLITTDKKTKTDVSKPSLNYSFSSGKNDQKMEISKPLQFSDIVDLNFNELLEEAVLPRTYENCLVQSDVAVGGYCLHIPEQDYLDASSSLDKLDYKMCSLVSPENKYKFIVH